MYLYPADYKFESIDVFGYPYVWVPFGKQGDVQGDLGIYQISRESIFNTESLNTLAGRPIYYGHAEVPTFGGGSSVKPIGITTDKYRYSQDGLGAEVLSRITCSDAYQKIKDKIISFASPCYQLLNNIRHYNHIALLNTSEEVRGGKKMQIFLEGFNSSIIPSIYDYYKGIEVNNPSIVKPYNITNTTKYTMDELLGTLTADMQILKESVANLTQILTTPQVEEVVEEGQVYQEGFQKGLESGQVLAEAVAHGYVGVDAEAAKQFVVNKAFTNLKLEGTTGDYLQGLYKGALSHLAAIVVKTENTKTVTIPEINISTATVNKAMRIKNGQT